MNFAGDVFKSPYGPLLQQLISGQSPDGGIIDLLHRPNPSGSTFIVPPRTSNADIDQAILFGSGLVNKEIV